ncbi:MAG: hypothetical protein FJ012_02595 [Chloroflexi bacterium]|nr:hypothetical protein [Chloroflexota bacterium]
MAALVILAITMILAGSACQESVRLTVENQTSIDLTIMHEAYEKDGKTFDRVSLGMVPAGQTVKLHQWITLTRSTLGWTVVLKAEDPSGQVIWQRSWSFKEFLELKKVGWKITISPESD